MRRFSPSPQHFLCINFFTFAALAKCLLNGPWVSAAAAALHRRASAAGCRPPIPMAKIRPSAGRSARAISCGISSFDIHFPFVFNRLQFWPWSRMGDSIASSPSPSNRMVALARARLCLGEIKRLLIKSKFMRMRGALLRAGADTPGQFSPPHATEASLFLPFWQSLLRTKPSGLQGLAVAAIVEISVR